MTVWILIISHSFSHWYKDKKIANIL